MRDLQPKSLDDVSEGSKHSPEKGNRKKEKNMQNGQKKRLKENKAEVTEQETNPKFLEQTR